MKNKISIIIILIMAVAIGALTYKVVTVDSEKESKECEKQEVPKLEVDYDNIKQIYRDFYINVDLLERFNGSEVTPKDFTDEDKLNIALSHILANKDMHEESEFDNSDGSYAQNIQFKITINQIKKVVKTIFKDDKFDYFPEIITYMPDLIDFKKDGDHYIGKQIISGHEGGIEYIYYMDGYDIKDNQVIVNVIAGYYYSEEFGDEPKRKEGLYKNQESTKVVVQTNHTNIYPETFLYYKDQLTNIKYIYDITEDGYQLNKITIN